MPVQTVIKLRRSTAAAWTSANPVLAAGEPGLETDTNQVKYGDGTTAWNTLEYAGGVGGGLTVSETAPADPEEGWMWFASAEAKTYVYYDSAWVEMSPAIAGPAGADGADGAAATIAVGTVATGAEGSSATVTNAGTSSAAVFNFSIPVGATGATGPTANIDEFVAIQIIGAY